MAEKDPEGIIATDPSNNDDRKCLIIRKLLKFNPKEVFTWQLVKTVAMSQGLAALICGTAVTSQYLASDYHVDAPMLQSFMSYTLLCLTYTTALLFRTGDENMFPILKKRWWKYLLLGLVDVEANYTVVKAYQYTTLTSIQLLDCFVIPVLMILSCWFLKTCYRPVHYVSVCVCLLGVGAMVGADLLAGRDLGSTSDILLGDGLVLLSASLYAVSNVCQEYTVKHLSRVEFLGMVGLFGTLISGIQLPAVCWLCPVYVHPVQLYAHSGQEDQCYSSQPLPAHCRPPQPLLWPVSLSIHVGFVAFNTVATTPDPADPIAPSVGWEECGYDNPDDIIEEVVVAVLEEEEGEHTGVSWNQRTQNKEVPAEGRSTKM
ncbi:solute carrier family 35 member F2-like isoform X3 [Oncorhynchus nerka]|uniref:solute carrier family 35 member F2-like isoform X3 n=1 Tax=Oncorhynchus nerka TaxID=8023 RepID=UPI0031B7F787